MPQVDESNFDQVMTCAMRDEFWRRVRLSLKDYFNESEALADRYRTALDAAPVGELLLVYREDPLSVAADLAGRRDQMPRHVAAYRQRFPDGFGLFQ